MLGWWERALLPLPLSLYCRRIGWTLIARSALLCSPAKSVFTARISSVSGPRDNARAPNRTTLSVPPSPNRTRGRVQRTALPATGTRMYNKGLSACHVPRALRSWSAFPPSPNSPLLCTPSPSPFLFFSFCSFDVRSSRPVNWLDFDAVAVAARRSDPLCPSLSLSLLLLCLV